MNAPENIPAAYPINLAHEVLLKSDSAMCVDEVTRAIVGKKPTKADIKPVGKLLKELADLGLIEMEPRAGGVPFYRLIVAGGQTAPKSRETRAVTGAEGGGQIESTEPKADMGNPITESAHLDFATSPELQYLAPEDYEMPPADPALLAMANRMQHDRLEGVAHVLRGCGLPDLADASGAEDLQPKVAALAGAYQMVLKDLESKDNELFIQAKVVVELRERLDSLTQQWEADTGRLTADLRAAIEARSQSINEADRWRREAADAVAWANRMHEEKVSLLNAFRNESEPIHDSAVGYIVRAPKRKPRRITKPEQAQAAALAAVRTGASRAEVLALVPVGVARRGAEWQGIKRMGKGD